MQAGDSRGRIAATQGTTVAAIAALNPQITNINLIYSGQVILLPGCDSAPADDGDTAVGVDIDAPAGDLIAVPSKPANLSQALWKPVHDATFNIRYPVDAPYVGGSGVIIGRDGRTFLTAYHVIDRWETDDPADYEQTVEIGPYTQWHYTADVLAAAPEVDLAMLRINEGDFPGFSVAPVGQSGALRFGDPIYTLSYPLEGTELRTSKGSFLERIYRSQGEKAHCLRSGWVPGAPSGRGIARPGETSGIARLEWSQRGSIMVSVGLHPPYLNN